MSVAVAAGVAAVPTVGIRDEASVVAYAAVAALLMAVGVRRANVAKVLLRAAAVRASASVSS